MPSRPTLARLAAALFILAVVALPALAAPTVSTTRAVVPGPHADAGVPLAWALPFVLMLAAIALMPFVARRFWEHHYPKVSFALAGLVALYYFAFRGTPGPWLEEMREYVSFIVLLGS